MASLTELIVQLGIKIDDKQLDKMRQIAVGFDVIKDAATNLGRVFTGGRGLKEFFMDAADQANELEKLSSLTSMSTDTIQEWQYAAKKAGVEVSSVMEGLKGLQRQFRMNDKGVMQLAKSFQRMSAGGRALQGQMMGLSDEMIYFLSKGPDFIRTAREEAQATKAIMDKDTIDKYKEASVKIDTIKTSLSKMAQTIAGEAAPKVAEFVGSLQQLIEENPEQTIKGITIALGGLITTSVLSGLTTLAINLKAVATSFALLAKNPLVMLAMGGYFLAKGTGEKIGEVVNSIKRAQYKLSQKPIKIPPTAIKGGEVILKGPHITPQMANQRTNEQPRMPETQAPFGGALTNQFHDTVININSFGPIQDAINGITNMFPGVEPNVNQWAFGDTNMAGGMTQ